MGSLILLFRLLVTSLVFQRQGGYLALLLPGLYDSQAFLTTYLCMQEALVVLELVDCLFNRLKRGTNLTLTSLINKLADWPPKYYQGFFTGEDNSLLICCYVSLD